jgi:heme/copper-type cytochrome/quinol oxidase subunit 4
MIFGPQEIGEIMASESPRGGTGRDVAIYIILLVLAATQFVIAYQDMSAPQMFKVMLTVAIVEGALALLFFMHLSENRGLMWFVVIFTVAVILGMQYGWTDSYRLMNGVPWAK